MTTAKHMAVSALQPSSECIIRSLGPDEKIAQRLAQMGVLPGTQLRIIRVAPLGSTIEVADAQVQSLSAETVYIKSLYEYKKAEAIFEKAIGKSY